MESTSPASHLTLSFVCCALLAGCGGSSAPGAATDGGADAPSSIDSGVDDTAIDDTTPRSDADEGGPSDSFPAPHTPLPTATSYGGPVVAHPKIVPVVFDVDPLAHDIETFTSAFAGTSYWQDVLKDYGIAKPVALPVVHVPGAVAASISDDEIQTWLAAQADGTHEGWPKTDPDTLYALFYPPDVTITYSGLGSSCTAFHGYHGETTTAAGDAVVYSVISRCASIPEAPVTGIQYVSAVASHEIVEGLTDPLPMTNSAYSSIDDDHLIWEFRPGGEVGDLCALVGDAFYTPTDFPYTVQRIWSNTAAASGHDPCIPQAAGKPYFNSAPVLPDDVTITYQGSKGKTKGVKIPVGESRTIELDLFSDAPTDAWTVSAIDETAKIPTAAHLKFAFDRTTGQNGDKLHLTITVLKKDPTYGGEMFILSSKLGTQRNLWTVFVGN